LPAIARRIPRFRPISIRHHWIATPNSAARRWACWRPRESSLFVQAFGAHGRTGSLNAG
jgi:hypothetical protein